MQKGMALFVAMPFCILFCLLAQIILVVLNFAFNLYFYLNYIMGCNTRINKLFFGIPISV